MSDDQFVIFTTHNSAEADLVRGLLESHGIASFVADSNVARLISLYSHALGGIRVRVSAADREAAELVLQSTLGVRDRAPFAGSWSPISSGTTGQEVSSGLDARWAIVCILLFVGLLAFFSPGRVAYFLGRTRAAHHQKKNPDQRFTLERSSVELKNAISQPTGPVESRAKAGDPNAQYVLGWKYYFGSGVPQNDMLAAQWMRQSADRGSMKGQYFLGSLYMRGCGVPKNESEMARWWQMAAERGYPRAQAALGWAYQAGRGVAKDEKTAAEWYRKAADQDEPEGEARLGEMLLAGRGMKQDYKEAGKLFEKAAIKGNSDAQFDLGRIYEHGLGVAKDPGQAYGWYLVSASLGNDRAVDEINSWRSYLNVEELTQAHEWATSYENQIAIAKSREEAKPSHR